MIQSKQLHSALQILSIAVLICIGGMANQKFGSHKIVKTNEGWFLVSGVTASHNDPDGGSEEITIFLDRNSVIRKIETEEYSPTTEHSYYDDWKVVTDRRKADPDNLWRYDDLIADNIKTFKEYRKPKPPIPNQNKIAISRGR